MKYISKNIQWVTLNALLFLIFMTLLRVAFFILFKNPNNESILDAFIMGLRYDVRVIAIPTVIIWMFSSIHLLNPFLKIWAIKFWNTLYLILFIVLLIFYSADFGHYGYLHQRLSATVLDYLKDMGTSTKMMWQSYPVIRWLLSCFILILLFRWLIKKIYQLINQRQQYHRNRFTKISLPIIFFLLLALGIFGRIGQYPLRWSDAQDLSSDYKANLALNPFQSFASTMAFREKKIDIQLVKKYYPEIASYYGLPINLNTDSPNITRQVTPRNEFTFKQPNVVLVVCESFSAYKSSMYGNPLNTTPFFNSLCSKGIFFERCFTPTYGTARGIWAIITGLPDVTMGASTFTRNPELVSQHTIINDFKGYEKLYFIGGSASWANIRGLLKHNIDNLHIYEQDDYNAPKIDVWGVSDKNVLLSANKILANQTNPFFSIIQTADNHRPYTIPEEDKKNFNKISIPKDSLLKYGFESEDEFNAFRYTDYCFQQFIEAAKKEKYFNNTIFVFIGDHGIKGNTMNMFPKAWTENGLTAEHVPLLFYAPSMLSQKRFSFLCSQLDVLPTIAGLCGINYTNTGFGTDILDPFMLKKDSGLSKRIMIFDYLNQTAGTAYQNIFFQKNFGSQNGKFYNIKSNESISQNDSMFNSLKLFTQAWIEWARYLAYTNKKKS